MFNFFQFHIYLGYNLNFNQFILHLFFVNKSQHNFNISLFCRIKRGDGSIFVYFVFETIFDFNDFKAIQIAKGVEYLFGFMRIFYNDASPKQIF